MALPNIQVITRKDSLINPINFELPYKSILYLNERHDKFMEQQGKMAASLGPLMASVHESERPAVAARWKSYMDQIDAKVDTRSGYAGNALGDSIRLGAEAAGDYFFIGRAKAKEDYDKYIDNLDKMKQSGVITDLTYNRLKAQNTYYYSDKYGNEDDTDVASRLKREQETGIPEHDITEKVSGGTTWKPQEDYVKHYGLDAIVQEAFSKFITPKKGSGESIVYIDKNGNETTNRSESFDGTPYIKTSTSTEKVTQDMINEAVNKLIESNPEYKASLYQDYKDQSFDYEKHPESYQNGSNFLNETGVPRGFEDYVKFSVSGLSKNLAYNYSTSQTTFDKGKANYIAAMGSLGIGAGNNQFDGNPLSAFATPNDDFQVDLSDMPSKTKAKIDDYKNQIAQIGQSILGRELTQDDMNNLLREDYVTSLNISPDKKSEILRLIDNYNDEMSLYNRFIETAPGRDQESITFISEVDSGSSSYSNNRWGNKFTGILKAHNVTSEDNIRFDFDDDDNGAYQLMYDALNTIPGVNITTTNGKRSISVPANNANNIMLASRAFAKAEDIHYWFTPNVVGYIEGPDKNNKIQPRVQEGPYGNIETYERGSMFLDINDLYNNAKTQSTYSLNHSGVGPATISNINYPGQGVVSGTLNLRLNTGEMEPNVFNARSKVNDSETQAKLYGHDLVDSEIYFVQDKGYMKKATNEEKQMIRDAIRLVKYDDLVINTASNPFSYSQLGINVTIPVVKSVTTKDGIKTYTEPYTVYIDGFQADSDEGKAMLRDTHFRALNDFERHASLNQPKTLRIGSESLVITPMSSIDGSIINNDPNNRLTREESVTLLDTYNAYRDLAILKKSGYDLTTGNNATIASKVIAEMAIIFSALKGGNSTYAESISKELAREFGITLEE